MTQIEGPHAKPVDSSGKIGIGGGVTRTRRTPIAIEALELIAKPDAALVSKKKGRK
jgi:hypothetical protein